MNASTPRGRYVISGFACIVIFLSAILIVYDVPRRIQSQEDLPQILGLVDHWLYYVPTGYFLDDAIHRGEFPLWNPLTFCGTPFAANPTSFVFYPPNLIRSALTFTPSPLNAHIGIVILFVLHLLMAGMGTIAFARRLGLSHGGALTAAFVFLFSAGSVRRTISTVCWIETVSWLPIILLLLHSAFSANSLRRKFAFASAVGLVFGISLLAGAPHMGMFMAVTIAGYGILFRLTSLTRASLRQPKALGLTIGPDALVGLIIGALALSVAAVMLVPAAELSGLSDRGNLEDDLRYRWHEVSWLLKLLVMYSGDEHQYGDYRLAGLGATLLALGAVAYPRRRFVYIFAALFFLFVNISLGPPQLFARLFIWLTPFHLIYPSRGMFWSCFPLAMLAGFGVDAVATRWRSRRRQQLFGVIFGAVGVSFLVALWENLPNHQYLPEGTNSVLIIPAITLGIVVLSSCLPRKPMTEMGNEPVLRGRWFQVVSLTLPILLLAELSVWSWHYTPFLLGWKGYKGSVSSLASPSALWQNNSRGFDGVPNSFVRQLRPAMNGYDPLYVSRTVAVMRNPPGYSSILRAGRTAERSHRPHLFLKRSFWLAKQFVEGPLPDHDVLFPSATTVFLNEVPEKMPVPEIQPELLSARSVSNSVERVDVGDAASLALRTKVDEKNPSVLVLTFPELNVGPTHKALVLHYRSSTPARADVLIRDLNTNQSTAGRSTNLEPTGTAAGMLEIPLPDFTKVRLVLSVDRKDRDADFVFLEAYLLYDREDENEHIDIVSRMANSVDVRLSDLAGPRVLTFVDTHYSGWKAYLDGSPTRILLANDAFKAVVVPAGTHDVRFEFRPTRVYAGLGISTVTVFGIALFLATTFRRKRTY